MKRMGKNWTLVADSGSTKTDWLAISVDGDELSVKTTGINPYAMDDATIGRILHGEMRVALPPESVVTAVHFYGAGCRGEAATRLQRLLSLEFAVDKSAVRVRSDLLGAAHALCGSQEGVVCILGTGSGSGLYDGSSFVAQVPSLGYILGDEGSGAVLGRQWVAEVFKGKMDEAIRQRFLSETGLTQDILLDHVYRQPQANRYLASFVPFLHAHREHPDVAALIGREFDRFFCRCVIPYGRPDFSVHFVGSVAWFFVDEVRKAACRSGLKVGHIQKSPLTRLAAYVSGLG